MKLTYTLWLIIINLAVFILQIALSAFETPLGDPITYFFALTPKLMFENNYYWQIFTYMFLHANFIHIFYNMFGLMIFGPKIEHTMGKKKFLKFYLICGVGSSLIYMLIQLLATGISDIPMVGASGALFGVLAAYGLMYPRDIVYVQFFLPMPAIVFVFFYGAMQVLLGIATLGMSGGIAYFGHVGGIVTAIILMKFFGFGRRRIRYFWE